MKKPVFIISVVVMILAAFAVQAQKSSTYIVLTTAHPGDPYYPAAQALATHRSAGILHFSADSIQELLPLLQTLDLRYAAIVLEPGELHINLVRQFLMMSTQLDPDPFSDFSYGYITGATAQDALDFVNNIILAESQNIQSFPLNTGGYAASSINFVYHTPGDYMMYLNPPVTDNIYLKTSDSASGLNFFIANSGLMQNKKLLDIGHNGDPHMLWLFEGGNNNPDPPIWNFDSTRIEDTAYARVGLTSKHIGALNLYPAVAFNGACHSGEPKKVMIEGDIAATFGDTQGLVKFYTMSDTFSFALQILNTGITGYFAPCGANNANDQSEEVYNAFLFNEPLGDVHKRTVDGVVMGFLGNRPNLRLYSWNESTYGCDVLSSGNFNPNDWSGACYMLGGKANRIYFGDPLFNPFQNHHSDSLEIAKAVADSLAPGLLDVVVNFKKPDVYTSYFPVWDKFQFNNTRIYVPVEVPEWVGSITQVQVIDSSGPYDLVIHALEKFHGKTILHIEVDIPNDMYSAIQYSIRLRFGYISGLESADEQEDHGFSVYPNPAADKVFIGFSQGVGTPLSFEVYDAGGRKVFATSRIAAGHAEQLQISTSDLGGAGCYFVRMTTPAVTVVRLLNIVR